MEFEFQLIKFLKISIFVLLMSILILCFFMFYKHNNELFYNYTLDNKNFDNNLIAENLLEICEEKKIIKIYIQNCEKIEIGENSYRVNLGIYKVKDISGVSNVDEENVSSIIDSINYNLHLASKNKRITKFGKFFQNTIPTFNNNKNFIISMDFKYSEPGKQYIIAQFFKNKFNRQTIYINKQGKIIINHYVGGSVKIKDQGFSVASKLKLNENTNNKIILIYNFDNTRKNISVFLNGKRDTGISNFKNYNIQTKNIFDFGFKYMSVGAEYAKYFDNSIYNFNPIEINKFFLYELDDDIDNILNNNLYQLDYYLEDKILKNKEIKGIFFINKYKNLINKFNFKIIDVREKYEKIDLFLKNNDFGNLKISPHIITFNYMLPIIAKFLLIIFFSILLVLIFLIRPKQTTE